MSNLIKNELIKIFKKKAIYIILFITLAFVILSNCLNKYFYGDSSFSYYSDGYVEYAREAITGLDPNRPNDTKMYIEYKTVLDVYDMMQEYDDNDWQIQIIASTVEAYITERNTYLYGAEKNEEQANKINEQIQELSNMLKNGDWRYFADEELKTAEEKVKTLEDEKNNTEDKQRLKELETEIKTAKIDLEVAKYRVDEDIKYGYDYMNTALENYKEQSYAVEQMNTSKEELTYQEKKEYNESVKEKEISKYIIENHVDIKKSDDVRGVLSNFFNMNFFVCAVFLKVVFQKKMIFMYILYF